MPQPTKIRAFKRRNYSAQPSQQNLPNQSQLWKFLNSPFMLWLLSAVLVSGISWAYTKWSSEQDTIRTRATNVLRLDQEISSRMNFATAVAVELQTLPISNEATSTDPKSEALVFKRVFGTPDDDFSLFPEFKDRTLESLMRELSQYLSGNAKECVLMAADRVRELRLVYLRVRPLSDFSKVLEADMGQVAELRWGEKAVFGQWSKSHPGVPDQCQLAPRKVP